jgi:tetratricopeptide (TPR) repeat protein
MMGWGLDPATRTQLRLERTRKALRARQYEQAVIEAEELLDVSPDHLDGLWMLAEAATDLGDFLTARLAYGRLVELDQHRPAILLGLALACLESADLKGCERAATTVAKAFPDFGGAHYMLGLVAELTGRTSEAIAHFEQAHRMGPLDYSLPVTLSQSDWQLVLAEAFGSLHPDVQKFWQAVPVRLTTVPEIKRLRDTVPPMSPRVAALPGGTPETHSAPEHLDVFQTNLAHAPSTDAMIDQLAQTLTMLAGDWLSLEGGS